MQMRMGYHVEQSERESSTTRRVEAIEKRLVAVVVGLVWPIDGDVEVG